MDLAQISLPPDFGEPKKKLSLINNAIPAEILNDILHRLSREDLRACLLTCLTLYRVVLPMLYHTLHITSNASFPVQPTTIRGMISVNYIRIIRVRMFEDWDKSSVCQNLRSLVASMPEDQLHDFQRATNYLLSGPLLATLWQTQRRMRSLEFVMTVYPTWHLPAGVMNPVAFLGKADLLGLRRLRCLVTNFSLLALPRQVFQKGAIADLDLDGRHLTWINSLHKPMELFRSPTEARLGNTIIIKNANLTHLRLADLELGSSTQTWFKFLDLTQLEVLNIEHCRDAGDFLGNLATCGTPFLKEFYLLSDHDDVIGKVAALLNSVPERSLQKISLVLRNTVYQREFVRLNRHTASLQALTLDIELLENNSRRIIEETGFIVDVSGWEKLTQLAITINMKTAGESLLRATHEGASDFEQLLLSLAHHMPNLSTLVTVNHHWPRIPGRDSFGGDEYLQRYCYEYIAKRLLLPSPGAAPTKLRVVAFGTRDIARRLPQYYVGSQETVFNRTRATVSKVTLKELAREETELDILMTDWRIWDATVRTNSSGGMFPFYVDDEKDMAELRKKAGML